MKFYKIYELRNSATAALSAAVDPRIEEVDAGLLTDETAEALLFAHKADAEAVLQDRLRARVEQKRAELDKASAHLASATPSETQTQQAADAAVSDDR